MKGENTPRSVTGNGFADPQARLVVVFATAAPGSCASTTANYREQMQDLVYGAMTR